MNIWTVQLGAHHTAYPAVEFKRGYQHTADHTVVIVDTERFMACFERDNLVIPPAAQWTEEKREIYREFLDPKGGAPEMPIIGFSLRTRKYKRLWGILSPRIETVPIAGFTNGRHRARYLQYAGASTMPVEVHVSEADLLRKYCAA